ncbi:16S rRNA (adenine(1518)-N(6)/adenine(1519)-N(6))-dimethyltransferase RsmA [Caenispirillum bisanense]|uniref:Ribosomal RNA small subunit methyltransferase A n=1 Tax=Caenispirillum bisanense TaxID=414052 RepID=A0A286G360_9PROT|nr:16S rRNA (adenine(1518)-N(6)/adenine(1519)-N(6))-dimethyltransferase RsmA [Caenispirillum bisanense]SOD89414.1 dimethyladenosine transferase [Caenispirillum bisanense]
MSDDGTPDLAFDGLPPLRDVIARHDLAAKKSLGQNFLLDLNLTGRIARSAGPLDQGTVIEIGPGPGGLTRALLAAGARQVIAIERDPRVMPALAEISARWPGRLEVREADALEIDVASLGEAPRRIVANLPYNVATPLLIGWLHRLDAIAGMTLMFQKEVVDRLVAKPRTKDYGRLSVITQWLCHVEPLFDINPRAFTPPPKIVSTVVSLTPRTAPLAEADFATLERVTAAAFGQRRKMLRASLKSLGGDGEALCAAAGVAPTARAEELTVEQFCAIARAL